MRWRWLANHSIVLGIASAHHRRPVHHLSLCCGHAGRSHLRSHGMRCHVRVHGMHRRLAGTDGGLISMRHHLMRLYMYVVHGVVALHIVSLVHTHTSVHVGLLHHVRSSNDHLAHLIVGHTCHGRVTPHTHGLIHSHPHGCGLWVWHSHRSHTAMGWHSHLVLCHPLLLHHLRGRPCNGTR